MERPITTNGGHATAKFDRARQSKHAIIYTGKKPPNPLRGEYHLRKTAIRAIIVESPKKLDKQSRVDYSTEVSVEHTDELSHLGWVESSDLLLEEWKKVRGDTEFSAQGAGAAEAKNAAGGHTSQSRPSSAPVGRRGTGSGAETDAQERAQPAQPAATRPGSLPPFVRAGKNIANLRHKEAIIKNGCLMRLSKNQKSKRLQPDSKIHFSGH